MAQAPSRPRRFQFTLRRLLIFTTVVGLLLALITQRVGEYRRSSAAAFAIAELGGSVSWNPELLENLIKDQTWSRITDVYFSDPELDVQQWQTLSRIPHRFALQIDGQSFTNDSMTHLVNVRQLKYLVVDNTAVDEGGVVVFQRQRPNVTVMFGYPGDAHFRGFRARSQSTKQ